MRRACVSAALIAWLAVAATAGDAVPVYDAVLGGPSTLLHYSSGASPYSGIGRYEGRLACTAFFLATFSYAEEPDDAPAYAVTNGHCAAYVAANDVVVERPGTGRIIFNYFADGQRRHVEVPVARTVYATMKGRDIAVLELGISYRALTRRLIRPWPISPRPPQIGDPIAIVGVPRWHNRDEEFLRLARCRVDGVAPLVVEHTWYWFDTSFNRCLDVLPGSSGSPVFSMADSAVVGIVNTSTRGAPPMTACSLGYPCEPLDDGARARPDTNYVSSLAGVDGCFDDRHRFNPREPGCPLDPGTQLRVFPSYIGAVNPRHTSPPIGSVRRSWHVTVSGSHPFYRYAVVGASSTDCRHSNAYGSAASVELAAMVDPPLPSAEGFAFLCIAGTSTPDGTDPPESRLHATLVIARVDTTPPKLPAQVRIEKRPADWRISFATVGDEVAFHAFKIGPASAVRCADPAGYQLAPERPIDLPPAAGPYRLCVVPYDAAQNAGSLYERLLT
jgi:hypothetical protein